MRRTSALLVAAALLFIAPAMARAQKAPGLGYVYPPAIGIGQATEVQLGGFDFTIDMQWFVHHPHVQLRILGLPGDYHLPPPPYWIGPRASTTALPIPREVAARIEVDREASPGLVRWQVANANGSSTTAVFYVSHGPEIMESRSRDFPQRLPSLPVAVSGRLSRLAEVDRYEVLASRDGPISMDLMARRLGADFGGMLQVHDASGRLLADFADTQGLDGGATFTAKAGETYTISLNDVDFRGDRAYVYRLAVVEGPRVACTLPAAGQRGTSHEMEFIGFGLTTGKPVLESIRQTVAFPDDPAASAHTHSLQTPFGKTAVLIPLSNVPERVRDAQTPEPAKTPLTIVAPVAVSAILPLEVDEHRYAWHAEKNESWKVQLQSRAVGGKLDVALSILGPDGKTIGQNDDLPGTTDAEIEFRAPASGSYSCIVRSMSSSRMGTAEDVYRLLVQRQPPDFALTVPQQVNLPSGGKSEVTVQATRAGGFDGEIVVTVEGLPPGVTSLGELTLAKGKSELKLALEAAADAAVVACPIQFRGTAKLGDAMVTHQATASAGGNLAPRTSTEPKIPQVLLAMTMPAPFEIRVVDRERQHDVHRGTTFLAELEIVRKDGFAGEIQLEMSAQQSRNRQGIRGPIVSVPAGVTRTFYPCFMPEWLGTDLTRRMVIHGVAAVADPKGNLRYLTKSGDARITMIMEGALLKLTSEAPDLTVHLGDAFDVPVHLSRSAKLPITTTVELVVPDEIAGLLHAERLVLPPGVDRGTLRITPLANLRLLGPWSLKLTATALQERKWPVVSETEVPVMILSR